MKNGSWTELAQLYPVAFVEQNVSEELTPEKLASWWDVFGDPTMTDLITRALEKNRDLASARASVKEARYQLGISEANLLPWLDANGSWSNAHRKRAAARQPRPRRDLGDRHLRRTARLGARAEGYARSAVRDALLDVELARRGSRYGLHLAAHATGAA